MPPRATRTAKLIANPKPLAKGDVNDPKKGDMLNQGKEDKSIKSRTHSEYPKNNPIQSTSPAEDSNDGIIPGTEAILWNSLFLDKNGSTKLPPSQNSSSSDEDLFPSFDFDINDDSRNGIFPFSF